MLIDVMIVTVKYKQEFPGSDNSNIIKYLWTGKPHIFVRKVSKQTPSENIAGSKTNKVFNQTMGWRHRDINSEWLKNLINETQLSSSFH